MRSSGARREFRAAVVVLVVVVAVSLFAGMIWGLLAPTELVLVVEPGRGATLVGESQHRFDALAIFAGAGAVTALVTAIAAWRWRRMRGPLQFGGLLLGSMIGAAAMAWLGETVNAWDNPRPDDPPVGQIVTLPIDLEIPSLGDLMSTPAVLSAHPPLVLLVQPLVVALVILLLAGFSTGEDLGTGWVSPFGDSRPAPLVDPEPGDVETGQYRTAGAQSDDPGRAGVAAGVAGTGVLPPGDSPPAGPPSLSK